MLLAAALLGGGCQIEPDNPEQFVAKAQQAREKGDQKSAVIQLRNAAKLSPDDPRVRYLLGLSYLDDGQFEIAAIELRKARALNYDAAKVVPALGRSLLAMKQYDVLLVEVPAETEGDASTRAEILTLRALASLGLSRVAEGRDLLERALAVQPEFADALVGQAVLAGAARKFDEASSLVDRALASKPGNVDAWLLRGDLDRVLKRDSATAYRKALELDPKNVLARLHLASMLVAAEKHNEARVLLREIHDLAPNDVTASYMEGFIEFRNANYVAAREWTQRALKAEPGHLPSLLLAGAIEFAQGHYRAAEPYLAGVVDRIPGNLYARKLLAVSLKENGQTSRAREVVRSGLFHTPNEIDLLVLAGDVEMQANDLVTARGYYERATKLDPEERRRADGAWDEQARTGRDRSRARRSGGCRGAG